jgi:hypothetical protein
MKVVMGRYEKEFCPLQPRNQWLDVLNDYIIDYNHRILFQILCGESCYHILVMHLTSRWCGTRKDDIVFSLHVFIHMAFTIDDKVMWMFTISFENVIRIKSFQIWLNNDYANHVDKIMCHYIDNVIIKLFYNVSKLIISNWIWVYIDMRN